MAGASIPSRSRVMTDEGEDPSPPIPSPLSSPENMLVRDLARRPPQGGAMRMATTSEEEEDESDDDDATQAHDGRTEIHELE